MKPLPLPVRIAAGLVATAVEQARDLPRHVVEFPVTAVSQALQASMRVQQKVTELAIKGDRALGALRPVEEKPSWATFDEDESPRRNGRSSVTELRPSRPEPEPEPDATPDSAGVAAGVTAGKAAASSTLAATDEKLPGKAAGAPTADLTGPAEPAAPGHADPGQWSRAERAARLRRHDHPAAARAAAPAQRRRPAGAAGVGARAREPAGLRHHADQPDLHGHRRVTTPPTAERPWPVRTVARKIAEWDRPARARCGWRASSPRSPRGPGTGTAFLVLRDPAADVSLQLTVPMGLVRDGGAAVAEGKPRRRARQAVVLPGPGHPEPARRRDPRGRDRRAAGRIERLRRLLAAEGLFDPARKRRPPFLPRCIGLVTGRASAAEHDVVTNAQARWPAVRFRVEPVAVQGRWRCPQIVDALRALDRDPDVDVIVLARGGGSVEDLLPFSDETLCRAVADCRTPVVSAIGHEPDTPLVDHVADVRCSTPTEAGRRLVPDLAEESARIAGLRDRARRALGGWVDREERLLAALRGRPVLAEPLRAIDARAGEVERLREAARSCVVRGLDRRGSDLEHVRARLATLGPAATLARGYAVVQRVPADGDGGPLPVLRSVDEVGPGDRLRVRVADGAVVAAVTDPATTGPAADPPTTGTAASRPRTRRARASTP
jgi:exodeoxyribonuclease VII large subunit